MSDKEPRCHSRKVTEVARRVRRGELEGKYRLAPATSRMIPLRMSISAEWFGERLAIR